LVPVLLISANQPLLQPNGHQKQTMRSHVNAGIWQWLQCNKLSTNKHRLAVNQHT